MSRAEYSLFVSLFFFGYFLCEVPSNMIMVKLRPSVYLSTIIWVWGCLVIGMSQIKTFEGMLAARFFLGCIEAGLFPGAIFLLTCWYTKKETGKPPCHLQLTHEWQVANVSRPRVQPSDSVSSIHLGVSPPLSVASWPVQLLKA
jgi:sugar phosphate permease